MTDSRESVIECHERWPAARAFECPQATLQVSEIGRLAEVSLTRILGSQPAPESLNDAAGFRFQ
jgi:hypothetical protein